MGQLRFSWDTRKARSNEQKHGVSFEEAETVFLDDNALLLDDPDHSWDEKRFVLLGLSSSVRVLLVCHCFLDEDTVVSSARGERQNRSGGSTPRDLKNEKRIRLFQSEKESVRKAPEETDHHSAGRADDWLFQESF